MRRWSFKCLDASMFVHRPLCSPLYMFANVGGGGGGNASLFHPALLFFSFCAPRHFRPFFQIKAMSCWITFRGKSEGNKALLDLSIIVCRTSSDTTNPKPLSLVCHSKRQVKSNVSCSGILEEGTYMIGMYMHAW